MSIYIGDKEIKNLYVGESTEDYSAMRGPCDEGFHVPSKDEWDAVKTIWESLGGGSSDGTNFGIALKLPFAGQRQGNNGNTNAQGSDGRYRSSMYNSADSTRAYYLYMASGSCSVSNNNKIQGFTIRPFKDSSVAPTSSWTKLYGTSIESGGIFWSNTDGLISLSSNGTTWLTISDKNLGATYAWNNGETLSQTNCGKYYQWGNNYGFPFTGSITTSSTQVNASAYGPGNYYSSSTFIYRTSSPYNWDSSDNNNLRGGETGTTEKGAVKAVYLGENKVRPSQPAYPTESIVYKMNTDSSGNLYVPTGGYGTDGGLGASYNWKVSVDGGTETTYTGTSSNGGNIILSGYTSGESHTIMIKPTAEAYGWARAYSWFNTTGKTYLTEIIYDGSYMGFAVSATATGDYFRYREYQDCTNLLNSPEEALPDTVTSIGTYFMTMQFMGCTSLNKIEGWKDLSIGNSYYRYRQYYQCTANKTVKVLSDVGYASYNNQTLQNAYVTTVNVPSAYLSNFINATVQPRSQITDSKFVGY